MTEITTAERAELRATIAAFLGQVSGEGDVRRMIDSPEGFDRAVWERMATELGVQGLGVPDRLGGSGLGWSELAVVFEEAGRTLLCAPLLATVVAETVLAACARPEGSQPIDRWRAAIADGSLIASFALGERLADNSIRPDIVACSDDGAIRLTGSSRPVLDGGEATLIVVGAADESGFGLYAIDTSDAGVSVPRLQALDLTRRLHELVLSGVPAMPLASGGRAVAAAQRALDLAGVALAAEQLGAMAQLLATTVDYTKQRHQFGRAIGSFQAVKHTCADMLVDVEAARSTVEYAASAASTPDLPVLSALVQAQVTEAGSRVAAAALQMHGAIAYTWEHVVHLYLRRAKSTEFVLGSPALHRDRLVSLIGL